MAEKTFVRITNRMIYEEIQAVKHLAEETNGTVKWHTKAICGLAGLIVPLVGWIIHIALQ